MGLAPRIGADPHRVGPTVDMEGDVHAVVLRGARPGPRVLLVGGVHGDELNGIATVWRALRAFDPARLAGELVGVPVANPAAFRTGSRYAADGSDLNRCFPGNPSGSTVERLAHALLHRLVLGCDAVLDFHTAAAGRANLPHVRCVLDRAPVRALARAFGVPVVLHRRGHRSSLRRCATEAGVPTVAFEAGGAGRVDPRLVRLGLRGVRNVLTALGMLEGEPQPPPYRVLLRRSVWLRVPEPAAVELTVAPGDLVYEGSSIAVSGTVGTDPRPARLDGLPPAAAPLPPVLAPFTGLVLGVAARRARRSGSALCHLASVRKGLELLQRHRGGAGTA